MVQLFMKRIYIRTYFSISYLLRCWRSCILLEFILNLFKIFKKLYLLIYSVLCHTQQCSGVTPNSALRDGSGDYMMFGDQNLESALPAGQLFWSLVNIFFSNNESVHCFICLLAHREHLCVLCAYTLTCMYIHTSMCTHIHIYMYVSIKYLAYFYLAFLYTWEKKVRYIYICVYAYICIYMNKTIGL